MNSTYVSAAKEQKAQMKSLRKAAAAEKRQRRYLDAKRENEDIAAQVRTGLERRYLDAKRENEAVAAQVRIEAERRAAAAAGIPYDYDVERAVDTEWDLFVSKQTKPCYAHKIGIRRYRSLVYCDCSPDGKCEAISKRVELFKILEGRS